MHGYLTDRKHRTKINNSFIDFINLPIGVPKASGPPLIFISVIYSSSLNKKKLGALQMIR